MDISEVPDGLISNINTEASFKPDVLSFNDYFPFGMLIPRLDDNQDAYRYGFQGSEKDDEIKGEGNSYTIHFRQLDPRVGRWLSIDPEASSFPWQSPYVSMDNNPVALTDVFGNSTDDWVEKNGKMFYDNRVMNQDDALALYGEGSVYREIGYNYTSSSGSNIILGDLGFFKENDIIKSSPDLAKNSLAYTDPEKNNEIVENEIFEVEKTYFTSTASMTVITTDAVIPDPSDVFIPKWVVYAVAFVGSAYYIAKMNKEIERIKRKSNGPQGYMYSLTATITGDYPVMTWGFPNPTSNVSLNKNSIWKYGETSSRSDRYTKSVLQVIGAGGVNENIILYGNRVQIKVAEKQAIYGYFILHGHLPPGNKMFR